MSLKTLKMHLSTSVWGAQHTNAGQNIQQLLSISYSEYDLKVF